MEILLYSSIIFHPFPERLPRGAAEPRQAVQSGAVEHEQQAGDRQPPTTSRLSFAPQAALFVCIA